MKLFTLLKNFRDGESGAVTVDWVVLTAAVVGLGIAVLAAISSQVKGVGDVIGTELNKDVTAQGAQTDS